jgi:hypothetical protein
MFSGREDAEELAKAVSDTLCNYDYFKSHSRHINIGEAQRIGLEVDKLESDQTLQDLVLSVFHATTITFDKTACVKLIENHEGRAFIKLAEITVEQKKEESPRK